MREQRLVASHISWFSPPFLEIFGPASRNFGRKAALAERSYAGRCKEMIVHINSYGPQPIRLRLGVGAVGFRAPVRSMV